MTFDFDLFVIGGGSGGVRAARIAAGEYGARVGLAEESRMGGTCVIRGCVPKKLMIFASEGPSRLTEARAYGWTKAEVGPFDWPTFRAQLDQELDRLEAGYTSGLTGAGVEIFRQRARLTDPHTVELADGTRHSARRILIATGGRPTPPGIAGEEHCLISDDLFLMETLPRRMLIVGGGYIACEFATLLTGMGVETVLAHRNDTMLRGFDAEMRGAVVQQLRDIGVDLRLSCPPVSVERTGDGLSVTFQGGGVERFDKVLFAIGRKAYTKGLGLEEAGVKLGRKGEVVVDEWSQTTAPSIYAVGDVVDQVNLTPVAIRAGHNFADTVFGAKPRPNDFSQVASAVFTRPHELASLGLTEEEAAEAGPIAVYSSGFRPMRSLFAGSEARAVMKLIVARDSDRVLGCHIFGPEAGEIIQMAATAMAMGATKADFDRTVAVHPTLAEELVTLRKPTRLSGPDAAGLADAAQKTQANP